MKHILTAVCLLCLVIVSGTSVAAHNGEDHIDANLAATIKQRIEVRQEGNAQIKVQQRIQVCDSSDTKLDQTIIRYNTNGQRKKTQYQQVSARLKSVVERLKSAGVDTSQLELMIPELDQKIAEFNTDIDALVSQLHEVKELPCDESETFQLEINSTRAQQQLIRSDIEDIKTYYRDTVRPAIVTAITAYSTAAE
jgi:DNA repair exonuclease SbcCD ATPase subunit